MVMRALLCSLVVLLVGGSSAFGNILQDQGFNIGSANLVHLTEGEQSGNSMQNLTIDLSQVTSGSQWTIANVTVFGTTTEFGSGLLGASSLLGSAHLGTHSLLPMTGLLMPFNSGSLSLAQSRARLLGQLLAN
jgi:hypothetical protein